MNKLKHARTAAILLIVTSCYNQLPASAPALAREWSPAGGLAVGRGTIEQIIGLISQDGTGAVAAVLAGGANAAQLARRDLNGGLTGGNKILRSYVTFQRR